MGSVLHEWVPLLGPRAQRSWEGAASSSSGTAQGGWATAAHPADRGNHLPVLYCSPFYIFLFRRNGVFGVGADCFHPEIGTLKWRNPVRLLMIGAYSPTLSIQASPLGGGHEGVSPGSTCHPEKECWVGSGLPCRSPGSGPPPALRSEVTHIRQTMDAF